MNLNIQIKGRETAAMFMFDHLHAYSQYLNRYNNFTSEFEITFTPQKNIVPGSVNILVCHMPAEPISDIDDYDLVLLDNADEPLEVSTETMCNMLQKYSHVYFIANALLDSQHFLYDRIIPLLNDGSICNDYYRRPFYPQYYFDLVRGHRTKNIVFVNGHNKAHRHHVISLLKQHVPKLEIRSNITPDGLIHETYDCFYESPEDSEFREWVNSYYPITRNLRTTYYEDSIMCGVDQRFGTIPPGYFPIDEFLEYNCVIFPESSWINHELSMTEKILKCFFAGTMPFPVAGAGIHKTYNDMGFYTAWNLLPVELQKFDQETDHRERSLLLTQAIKYLFENPSVFESKEFRQYVDHNLMHMYTYKFALHSLNKFISILKKHNF